MHLVLRWRPRFAQPTQPIKTEMERMSDTKECLQCAELVKARARICRFCGHTFAEEAAPPEALQLDLTDTVTVIFVGRLRGSTLEPTHLRMYFFRPEEKRYIEIKPRAVAGNAGWTPEGDQIVARPGSSEAGTDPQPVGSSISMPS